jgi:2-polyprenyl-3-methyl-5-hydroxy-6-metoxy-1,4-benzoquinol methylase
MGMGNFKASGKGASARNAGRRPPGRTPGTGGASSRDALDSRDLWERSIGFLTVWIVHLGRRYGLVQTLAAQASPVTASRLARLCLLHEPAVATWCEAARSHRILTRTGGGYTLPPRLRPLLAFEDHLDYLAGQFSYLALRSLDYDAFDDLFRKGVAGRRAPHIGEASAEATRWDHTAFLKVVLSRVPDLRTLLRTGARVLDLGCGRGEWDLRLAPLFPRSRFVGVDPDRHAISAARTKAENAGVGDRLTFLLGAGELIGSLGAFDVVHLGEVLSAVAAKAEVLGNCLRALRPSGYLVIAEGLIEREGRPHTPTNQLMRAMELDFALQGTRFLTTVELRALLRESRFGRPRLVSVGGGLWYVVAQRPDPRRQLSR